MVRCTATHALTASSHPSQSLCTLFRIGYMSNEMYVMTNIRPLFLARQLVVWLGRCYGYGTGSAEWSKSQRNDFARMIVNVYISMLRALCARMNCSRAAAGFPARWSHRPFAQFTKYLASNKHTVFTDFKVNSSIFCPSGEEGKS